MEFGDSRLDLLRGLRVGPERFVVEGAVAVRRLLEFGGARGFEVEVVACTASQRERLDGVLPAEVPVFVGDRGQLAQLAGFDFHRGVLACARRPAWRDALDDDEIAALRARPRTTIVVATGLADPRNLGAVIRNAAAFWADLVVVDQRGADPLSRLAIRASVGNVFRVPWRMTARLPSTLQQLREALSVSVVAATPSGAGTLAEFERPPRVAVLIGNEGAGLDDGLLASADHRLRIPVAAESDSINVAAASAILLHALSV